MTICTGYQNADMTASQCCMNTVNAIRRDTGRGEQEETQQAFYLRLTLKFIHQKARQVDVISVQENPSFSRRNKQ